MPRKNDPFGSSCVVELNQYKTNNARGNRIARGTRGRALAFRQSPSEPRDEIHLRFFGISFFTVSFAV